MSAISAASEHLRESAEQLMAPIGGYSIEKHLLIAFIGSLLLVSGPVVIGAFRGAGKPIIRSAQRDVMIGIACLLPVITFLGFFFFVGRGYFIALCADPE